MTQPIDFNDFVSGFVLEADEHLHTVNKNLMLVAEAVKLNRPEPRATRELFRSLHTIKGLASMVGAESIVDISHEMESILRTADKAGGRIEEIFLDLLIQGTRAIEERVKLISKVGVAGLPKAPAKLLEALVLAQSNTPVVSRESTDRITFPDEIKKSLAESDKEQVNQALENGLRALVIEFSPSPERSEKGLNITTVREKLAKLGDLIKVIPQSSPKSPTGIAFLLLITTDVSNSIIFQNIEVKEDSIKEVHLNETAINQDYEELPEILMEDESFATPSNNTSVRVDIRKLDETLERLSELVITRSKLVKEVSLMKEAGVDTRRLDTVVIEYTRQLKHLRTAITQARMVPMADLLQRLPLIVRGITKDSKKSVDMVIKAGHAEIDKAVADKVLPAIIHLIRNSVDHAIESKEERKSLNKAESGTIIVECDDSSGTHILLTISDDGKGISRERVAKKANESIAKNDDQLLAQITKPGLSTSDQITQTSGRGMGMDIVKRTVELLGGSLSLTTTEGQGTTFTILVPVSVTIVDVMSFISGGQIFVAPVAVIEEIIDVDNSQLRSTPVPAQAGLVPKLIERRGQTIPLLALNAIFSSPSGESKTNKALIVKLKKENVAFGIDRMLGRQEVVVRPLDDSLVRVTGISGATDMGDGNPTLVLDLTTLGAAVFTADRV